MFHANIAIIQERNTPDFEAGIDAKLKARCYVIRRQTQANHDRQIRLFAYGAHLVYFALFFFIFRTITDYSVIISLLLITLCSLVYGKIFGLLSGLSIALIQIASLITHQMLTSSLIFALLPSFVTTKDLLISALLPAFGFLSGYIAERFGINRQKSEKLVNRLCEDNLALKSRLEKNDHEFNDLTRERLYRRSWDSLIDKNVLNEQMIGLLLASLPSTDVWRFPQKSLFDLNKSDLTQKLFALLSEVRPEILAVMNLEGTISHYNSPLMAFYGYAQNDLPPHASILDYLLPPDAEKASANIAKAVRNELSQNEQYCLKSPDGGFSKLLVSPRIVFECAGNPLTLLACVSSPTVDSMQYGLDEHASVSSNLADMIQKNICCLSPERLILFVSPMVALMLGETPESMIGKKIERYIIQRQSLHLNEFFKSCQEGKRSTLEIEMVPHKGKRNIFLLDAFPSIGMTGAYLGATILIENITSVKLIEEALKHRLSMEKMISNISTRFISIKSTDLDHAILSVLKSIGDFEGAEESYVEIYQSKRIKNSANYHVFNSKGSGKLQSEFGNGQITDFNRYETVSISIVIEAEVLGFFRFYQERYHSNWFETDLELIRLIGEIIINALIRKENELDIKLNENRLATTLHSIGDAVIATDINDQIILMNKMAENLTGWRLADAMHHPLHDVFKPYSSTAEYEVGLHNPDDEKHLSEMDGQLTLDSLNGKKYFISVNQTMIKDLQNAVYGEVTVFRDVTKEKQEKDEIRYVSYHDKLTGLYNRAFFEEEMVRLNTIRQYPITIILGDCNGLKIANDIFGHLEGDKLLQTIAKILKKATRHEDVVARWGGDEFAIILPKTDEQAGTSVRERILMLCADADCDPIKPSLALGSATNTEPAVTSNDLLGLLKLAEDRMYRHKLMEGKSARNSILLSIEKMIFEKSYETEEHAKRLNLISQKLGQAIGLTDFELEELSLLSVLHDIGKIGIPDHILLKPAQLSDEEWDIMKKHSEKGYDLARSTPELASIADSILHHHEHWDGSGYPSGLRGQEIPKLSRILSIIDAYDVITHSRSYKKAQNKTDALKEIEKCSGSQFDPELSKVFIEIMNQ